MAKKGKKKKDKKKKEEKKSKDKKQGKEMSIWKTGFIGSLVVIVILLIAVFAGFGCGGATGKITADKASQKVSSFITEAGLVPQGTQVNIDSIQEEAGMYQVNVSISVQGQEQKIVSYVSKDGEYFFPSGMNMDEMLSQQQAQQEQQEQGDNQQTQEQEVPKSDKPEVNLHIMSFCPYGNKAEDTMLPVYNLLKDKVDWNIHYIVSIDGDKVSSLHGQKEVDQNMREACVLENNGVGKWFDFATYVNENCGSDGSCWETAAEEVGLNTNEIQTCVDEKGLELMKSSEEASNSAGATGSPTLIINGVKSRAVYEYGSPEAYKQAICSAFNNPPEECDQVLSGSESTSTGGQC